MEHFKLSYFHAVSIFNQALLITSGITAIITTGGSVFSLGILPAVIYFYFGQSGFLVFLTSIPISSILLSFTTMMNEVIASQIEALQHRIDDKRKPKDKKKTD